MNRVKRILLIIVPVVIFTVVFLYDVIRMTVELDIPQILFFRELLLAAAFLSLYYFFRNRFQDIQTVPKEMGNLLLVLLGADVLAALGHYFGGEVGLNPDAAAIRQSAVSVLWMTIVAVAFGLIGLWLLKFFKELVLYKRRIKAARNFILYLAVLLCACAVRYHSLRDVLGFVNSLLLPILIVLMIMNSFRQQWIVYLSKREKVYTLVYSALLNFILVGNTIYLSQDSFSSNVVALYSAPLQRFVELNCLFGSIYFGISFASTLFHLPTAEVFERKQSELNSLHSLSRLVTQVFDFHELLSTVTQMTMEVSGAQSSWLELADESSVEGEQRTSVAAKQHISQADIELLSPVTGIVVSKETLRNEKSGSYRRHLERPRVQGFEGTRCPAHRDPEHTAAFT